MERHGPMMTSGIESMNTGARATVTALGSKNFLNQRAGGVVYVARAGEDPAGAATLMKRDTKMCSRGMPAFQRPFLNFPLLLLLLLLLTVQTAGLMETNPSAPFLHLISSKVQAEKKNMERPSAQGESGVEMQGCSGTLRPTPTPRAARFFFLFPFPSLLLLPPPHPPGTFAATTAAAPSPISVL